MFKKKSLNILSLAADLRKQYIYCLRCYCNRHMNTFDSIAAIFQETVVVAILPEINSHLKSCSVAAIDSNNIETIFNFSPALKKWGLHWI